MNACLDPLWIYYGFIKMCSLLYFALLQQWPQTPAVLFKRGVRQNWSGSQALGSEATTCRRQCHDESQTWRSTLSILGVSTTNIALVCKKIEAKPSSCNIFLLLFPSFDWIPRAQSFVFVQDVTQMCSAKTFPVMTGRSGRQVTTSDCFSHTLVAKV